MSDPISDVNPSGVVRVVFRLDHANGSVSRAPWGPFVLKNNPREESKDVI